MGIIALALLFSILVGSVYYDVKEKRIPNFISLFGMFVGIGLSVIVVSWHYWYPLSTVTHWLTTLTLTQSFAGMAMAGMLPLLLYILGTGGAGDVKLAWAIGSIAGLRKGTGIILFAYLLAGLWGLIWIIFTGRIWKMAADGIQHIGHMFFPKKFAPVAVVKDSLAANTVAMAPFMLVGLLLVVCSGEIE